MSDPEVGTVATLYDLDGRHLLGEFTAQGWWLGGNDFLGHNCVEKWQPITTPEERRLRAEVEDLRHAVDCDLDHIEAYHKVQAENDKLRAEVERLREGIRRHRTCTNSPIVADYKLWELIESETVGGE